MSYFYALKNMKMKKLLLLILLLITNIITAQTSEWIEGPEGYGLNSPYTDRGMIPAFITGDDMFAFTRKIDTSTNVLRNYLVRINLLDDSMHVYDGINLSGTADFYSPVSFTDHNGFVYFRSAGRLYRVNKATNEIAIYINDCEHYYIWGNRIIYDMWNTSKSYVRNMTTNAEVELLTAADRKIIEVGAFYEYEGSLYFWASASGFSIRQNGIFKFNPATNVLTTFMLSTLQSSSNMYQGRTEVDRLNNNLVFLLKDSTYDYKYVSLNLTTQAMNPAFNFDTNSVYDSGINEPFVVGDQVFIASQGQTYVSDGISAPVESEIGGFGGGWFVNTYDDYLLYNDVVYTNRNTEEFGSEIWRTDGTADGTYMLIDLEPGEQDAFYNSGVAMVYNDKMYFATTSGSPTRLYSTDGTAEGTVPLTNAGEFSLIGRMKGYGNEMYFYGQKEEGLEGLYRLNVAELSVPSPAVSTLSVYPNPAENILHFSTPIEQADIYDTLGRKVRSITDASSVEISGLKSGIYYLHATSEGRSQQVKFIVK